MAEFDPLQTPDPGFRVPDLVQCVEGWRSWEISGEVPPYGAAPKLYSVIQTNVYWVPRRALEAACECRKGIKEEEPPCPQGACGYYSAKTREHLLSMNYHCVPLGSEILTGSGWKSYDQVSVGERTLGYNPLTGENEWTRITDVCQFDDAPLVELGNERWSAICTPNHRWWTATRHGRQLLREAALIRPRDRSADPHRILTAAPHRVGNGDFTLDEVELIAWLITDGHWSEFGPEPRESRRSWGNTMTMRPMNAEIFQAKSAGIEAIIRLEPIFGLSRLLGAGVTGYRWTVPRAIARSLWERVGMNEEQALVRFVLGLGPAALDIFMRTVALAEGNGRVIYQNEGPVLDAIALAAYRQGKNPRIVRSSVNRPTRHKVLSLCRPHVMTSEPRDLGRAPVWCPKTELGSWTMRQNGQILLTGNTYDGERSGMYCVIGRVANWGKVIEGTLGWRAQFSYPVELFVPYEIWKLARPLQRAYGTRVRLDNFLKEPGSAIA